MQAEPMTREELLAANKRLRAERDEALRVLTKVQRALNHMEWKLSAVSMEAALGREASDGREASGAISLLFRRLGQPLPVQHPGLLQRLATFVTRRNVK